ncbi:hypothetical protein O9K51_09113 [Purpureocillium lavendulum]|uniref:Uncharacterized protein n=1 Tax=Purpureocillium lavendulum TaxID=1247861 RepID=A0AB34FH12_9HYPO|nr:hypothetical protein O9K51_09113 [Purpureocillium lavendulum]
MGVKEQRIPPVKAAIVSWWHSMLRGNFRGNEVVELVDLEPISGSSSFREAGNSECQE